MTRSLLAGMALAAATLAAPAALRADPPARVARVSYVAGSASIRHGTTSDWMAYVLNYPVTTGDELWTDYGARTELHVGSTAMRLGERTDLNVLQIEDDRIALNLAMGTLELRVRTLDRDDDIEVETPAGTLTIVRPGAYRIDVDSAGGATSITVRRGAVRMNGASGTFDVNEGQTAYLTTGDSPSYDLRPAQREDDLDAWSAERDRHEDESESARYVSREMTGYEELDAYGRWVDSPAYGRVWIPANVAPGWAPYRLGYWAWVDPWGWTWIDQEPWGFAPFHYGRWAIYRGAWVWVPGERVYRPAYAPALVGFVGGGGWSVSVRFGPGGGVAWFPLAPGEVWVPPYHASERYVRYVNVTNVNVTNINVTNVDVTHVHYRNLEVSGAVTAVPREAFASARPVRGEMVPVAKRDLEHAEVIGPEAPVAPRHESVVLAAPRGRSLAEPPVHLERYKEPPRTDAPAGNAAQHVPMGRPAAHAPPAPRPLNPAVAEERAVERHQVVEHAQMQERHDKELSAPPAGVTKQEIRARQNVEQQQMESRHQAEITKARAAEPVKGQTASHVPPPEKKGNDKHETGKPPRRQ